MLARVKVARRACFINRPGTQNRGQEREFPMKRIIIAIVVLATGRIYAVSPIGPAASVLDQGQLELYFDYTQTSFDDLPVDVTVKVLGIKAKDTVPMSEDIDSFFGMVGYGFLDQADVFVRFGTANPESTGNEYAWGLGGRITIIERKRLDWGLMAQVNFFSGEDAGKLQAGPVGLAYYSGDLSLAMFQIAAGPVYTGEKFSVYGGPFMYWLEGDGEVTVSDGTNSIKTSFDVDSDIHAGGYVGISADVGTNVSINAEYQLAEKKRALSCGLNWRF